MPGFPNADYKHYVPEVKLDKSFPDEYNFVLIDDINKLREVLDKDEKYLACDTETSDLDSTVGEMVGYSFSYDKETGYYVPLRHEVGENIKNEDGKECVQEAINLLVEKFRKVKKIFFFNARFDMRFIESEGYDLEDIEYYDVAIGTWFADTNVKSPSLKWGAKHFVGWDMQTFEETLGDNENFQFVNPVDAVEYAGADAIATFALSKATIKYYKEGSPASTIDNKVLYPLMNFENHALPIDYRYLKGLLYDIQQDLKDLEREIYSMSGYEFNINSPKQVAEVLDDLGLNTGEYTKTGYMKTGKSLLKKLDHPMGKKLVEYKELDKLKGTYIETLSENAEENGGKLRFAYKNTRVPTGRLACGGDRKNSFFALINLQSIPKPSSEMWYVHEAEEKHSDDDNVIMGYRFSTEEESDRVAEGFEKDLNVRRSFIPENEDYYWVSVDFSSQELRIPTNLSGEPVWLQAFQSDEGDPHKETAIKLFGEENYDRDKRKKAKGMNFGMLYGMSKYSVKDRFNMDSLEEAEEFVREYKNTLKTLFGWIDRHKKKARKKGVVYTYFNRPRRLRWYFNHKKSSMRAFAYRSAVNTVIQGCKPYETRILTNEGYIPIGELEERKAQGKEIPNKVWTGENWAKYIPMYMGDKELYEIETSSGRKIECDKNDIMKVVTDEGYKWKSLEDMVVGDKLAINLNSIDMESRVYEDINYVGENNFSNDFSIENKDYNEIFYLMGYIIGDGYICNKKREDNNNYRRYIVLSYGEHEYSKLEKMKNLFEKWGLRVSEEENTHKPKNKESTRYKLIVRSKGFIEFLDNLGLKPNKNCYNKRIPESVWKGKSEDVYWFLKGLHDSDGAKKTGGLHLSNKELLEEVQILITQFGFNSNLFKTNDGWKLDIKDSKSYLKFLENKKIEKFVGRQIYKKPPQFLKEEFINKINGSMYEHGKSPYVVYNRVKNGGSSSVGYMNDLLKEQNKSFRELYWEDEIVSIQKTGKTKPVYTLSVADEKHQYVSEGFISKNCGADVLKISLINLWDKLLNHPDYKDDVIFMSTVHDEVNFSVKKERIEEVVPKIMKCMELDIKGWPIKMECDFEIGPNWGHMFEFTFNGEGKIVPVTEKA